MWNTAMLFMLVIITINVTHMFFYLRLNTRSPFRYLLLYILVPAMYPIALWAAMTFPRAGIPAIFAYFLYCACVFRLLVTEDGFGRILLCVAIVVGFYEACHILPLSVMVNWMRVPPEDAVQIAAFVHPVVFFVSTPFLLRYVRGKVIRVLDIIEPRKWYFSGLPLLLLAVAATIGNAANYLAIVVPVLPDMISLGILAPLCIVVYYASMYFFFANHRDKQFLRQQLAAAGRLEHAYNFYGKKLEEGENRLRTLRHDFRHLALHLGSLARNGDLPGLMRELDAVAKMEGDSAVSPISENGTVNAVVSYHFARAGEKGVQCVAKAFVPADLPLPDADLSLLLGNALENCVKAAGALGERGYIAFSAKIVRGYLAFTFENNCESGRYPAGEKMGLLSIRQLCERHHGRAEVSDRDRTFTLTAFVPMM